MTPSAAISRENFVRRGQRLEYFTIGYNSLEGLVSIVAGIVAGSVSLIGFGLDSIIEVVSGAALLWRLHHDPNPSRREQLERTTLRIVGSCFVALALYILFESVSTLIRLESPNRSIPGIIVAAVSVVVMPMLARAKRRVAAGIGSGAMQADSRQTEFCTYLSAILLAGFRHLRNTRHAATPPTAERRPLAESVCRCRRNLDTQSGRRLQLQEYSTSTTGV